MNQKGASPFRILLIAAAMMIGIVFLMMGQLFFAGAVLVAALILGVAALFARAKTPTD
jgi:hypothetical protein